MIIALYSPRARSGKGTVAKVLVSEYGFIELQFSTPIKEAWRGLLAYADQEDLFHVTTEGAFKQTPLPELGGLSFRTFAETLGTRLREDADPQLWIKMLHENGCALNDLGYDRIVVSDMRFANELDYLRSLGAKAVWVERPELLGNEPLPSEGHLIRYDFDYRISTNDFHEVPVMAHEMAGCFGL